MKSLVTLMIALFATAAYADKIDCTTRFMNIRTDQSPNTKVCGAVSLDRAFDDGIKYRRQPRACEKLEVEFFSIRASDDVRFTTYCDEINSKNCYMIGIRDTDSHQGIARLYSHMVFSSINAVPTIFNLHASGIGHSTGSVVKPGRLVNVDLSCRKSK